MMRSILVLLTASSVSPAPKIQFPKSAAPQIQFPTNNLGCTCNGQLNSKGHGECRSEYEGRAFCYVDPGKCSDQAASSTEGRWWTRGGESLWEFHWWSYQACEEFLSEAPTTVGGNIDQHCWCESEQAPFIDIRFHQHQPLCGVGEWMVCHGEEEEEEEEEGENKRIQTPWRRCRRRRLPLRLRRRRRRLRPCGHEKCDMRSV